MKELTERLHRIKINPKVYKDLPDSPGIYIYFKCKTVIYVGKAISLKNRVSSYFGINLIGKTAKLMSETEYLSFIQVSSELEALLLEAKLIRTYQPRYNIVAKDDKHPLYIRITKEEFPRIITARKIEEKSKNIAFYGPFPSSGNVTSVLKMIRKIFPYSDHKLSKRACLYSHIGLCDPCPNEIAGIKNQDLRIMETKRYKTSIRHIKAIMDGKISHVRDSLEKEMNIESENENFEKALILRNKIQNLVYITRPQMPTNYYLENPNLYEDQRKLEIKELKKAIGYEYSNLKSIKRIECYDVAHLSGVSATASMVTFIDGVSDKSFYRHFRIRQTSSRSDIDSLREVIARRIRNLESWGVPDLIIVDGGTGQVNVFKKILQNKNVSIPVIGIAKHPDRLIFGDRKIKLEGLVLNLVSRMRDEAHRFARRYHHKLIAKSLISGK